VLSLPFLTFFLLFLVSLKYTAYAKLISKGIIESQSNIFEDVFLDSQDKHWEKNLSIKRTYFSSCEHAKFIYEC